ncbi:MAG: DUF4234 domain-containing protein [Gammaproteobacteria bacterium]|jgi:hypothetical protein
MENESNNIYKAPESELEVSLEPEGGANNFKRFSAWGVFGLTVITIGIYPLYWLYTRSQILNKFHRNKVSNNLLQTFVILVIISFSLQILSGVYAENMTIVLLNGVFNILYIVAYLMVLFKLSNRLTEVTGNKMNTVATFFFTAIYLQYKINVAIDEGQ